MKPLNEYPTAEMDAHIRELIRNPEISGSKRTLTFARNLEQRLLMCQDALKSGDYLVRQYALEATKPKP